ncbi:MAG: DegT/DnrJ/EryC1/StrS family aminotransferase [Bacteroidia bacterium]|jgi:dTDP-4-amino-4,6-dideoxygalactose transaminase|nr:DegT/DnrJ/EryC1/StrS family aminotransferase [Bacteroidia bacterium]
MKIPFSPPYIDEDVISEVVDSLKSGWITTGPKVRDLEKEVAKLSGVEYVACINSWTSGATLILKWFNIGPGDEVILPAYTYAATALVVLHAGAKPVMVDVNDDFTINSDEVAKAITAKTKAIFSVDFAGYPCNYDQLNAVIESKKELFQANSDEQNKLNRILLISDAAHSIGAKVQGKPVAVFSDICIYSFHAVKNLTTAEGGAICVNLPQPFNQEEEYKWLKLNSLNGQTKDAFAKSQAGSWRYDIVSQGLKINMPDISAAIGLAQLRKYDGTLLPKRREIYKLYNSKFGKYDWFQSPPFDEDNRSTSAHLFPLRIKGITEEMRDEIIQLISKKDISVNVHFIPLPMLSLFKNKGYNIKAYPRTYNNYSREISLPIYPQLGEKEVDFIVETIVESVNKVIK